MEPVKTIVGIVAGYVIVRVITWIIQWYKSPFAYNTSKPRLPYVIDQPSRARVLKQQFSIEKVPTNLDAIIIGAGCGGLATAATLAKAGKKVLVLEQHDQAGGGMHTFTEKGYEFEPGLHYVGETAEGSLGRMLFDQITEGQVEWAPLEDSFDKCSIGSGDDIKFYNILKGRGNEWKNHLKKQFPGEEEAIDKYFEIVDRMGMRPMLVIGALKLLPLWLCWLLAKTGIVHLLTIAFRRDFEKSSYDIVCELTENKDLRTVMTYAWLDLLTRPSKMHFPLHALVVNHYRQDGSFYPVGGASEMAMSLIPIIERAGGKVLVRANIEEILHNGQRVHGVSVRKGSTNLKYNLEAPITVSTAGMYNTFYKLLPKDVASKSSLYPWANRIGPSSGAIYAFIGLNASSKELCLPRENVFYHIKNDNGESIHTEFGALPREEAIHKKIPAAFVGTQSAKNPNWDKDPENRDKSTIFVATGVPYDWFKDFEGTKLLHRGDEYERTKAVLGQGLVDIAQEVYPQIKHHIDLVEFATPLTNNHYFGQNFGESYGMVASAERFKDPWLCARLRAETDIPGLLLSGQDSFAPGVYPGFCSGVMTASHILGRNLFVDLLWLHFKSKI